MERKKLRILAAGDIHGDSATSKKLAEKAKKEKVDLVVLTGDFTSWIETKNFLKPFKDRGEKVLLLPGNHENFATADFLAEVYGMKNIHGYSLKYGNVGIFGAGGALEFNTTDRELFDTLKKGNDALKGIDKKIMVTHMHVKGTKSEFSGVEGSAGVRRAIEKFQPDFLLHGHIHEAEGLEDQIGKTKVICVGRNGTIIDV